MTSDRKTDPGWAVGVITTIALTLGSALVVLVWDGLDLPRWCQICVLLLLVLALLACLAVISLRRAHRSGRPAAISAAVLILGSATLLAIGIQADTASPDVRWVADGPNGGPKISRSQTLLVRDDWISGDRARVPIQLAFGNQSGKAFTDITVQISYPRNLEVLPHGTQVLDPENRTIVIEHGIGDLSRDGAYVRISRPDVLVLAVKNFGAEFLVPPADPRIPPVEVRTNIAIVGGSRRDVERCQFTKEIALGVAVFSDGEKVADSELYLRTFRELSDRFTINPLVPKAQADQRPFRERGSLIDSVTREPEWAWSVTPGGQWGPAEVSLARGRHGAARYQFLTVSVAGQVLSERLTVDSDGDGDRDWDASRRAQGDWRFAGYQAGIALDDALSPEDLPLSQSISPCGQLTSTAARSGTGGPATNGGKV